MDRRLYRTWYIVQAASLLLFQCIVQLSFVRLQPPPWCHFLENHIEHSDGNHDASLSDRPSVSNGSGTSLALQHGQLGQQKSFGSVLRTLSGYAAFAFFGIGLNSTSCHDRKLDTASLAWHKEHN